MRGPLAPAGVPLAKSPLAAFEDVVISAIDRLERRLGDQLLALSFHVEDVPPSQRLQLDSDWPVLAETFFGGKGSGARIVLYRHPIVARADGLTATRALVTSLLVEQVAEALGVDESQIDPRS